MSKPRLRTALLVSIVPAILVGGAVWRWAARPFADADEVAELRGMTAEALRDARRNDCPRPVLRGDPIPGDGTDGLARLVDPEGPFATCLALARAEHAAVRDVLLWDSTSSLELPEEGAEDAPALDDPPPPEGWEYVAQGRSYRRVPLPIEEQLLAACPGLDVAVEQVVQHASVCTVDPLGGDRFDESSGWSFHRLIDVSRVLAVFARDRMRRGEVRRGFELLLDGVRLATDVQRGRPSVIAAAIAEAMINLIAGQIVGLVAQEQSWSHGDLDTLTRESQILAVALPTPVTWIADDSLVSAMHALRRDGWEPPEDLTDLSTQDYLGPESESGPSIGDATLAVALHIQRHLRPVCDGATTREACSRALRAEVVRAPAEADTTIPFERVLPQLAHDRFVAAAYAEGVEALERYVVRTIRSEATIRALPVLFIHRRLGSTGPCPDAAALEAAISGLPLMDGFGGRIEILPTGLPYRPLDICAPAWLAPPGAGRVRLSLLNAYCPPFPARDVLPTSEEEPGPAGGQSEGASPEDADPGQVEASEPDGTRIADTPARLL